MAEDVRSNYLEASDHTGIARCVISQAWGLVSGHRCYSLSLHFE